jgi:hypothetical protein
LHHLLNLMPHPDGGTYYDHTLVVSVSEFSRNNTEPDTGFNSGLGSDHQLEEAAPMRNQAVAVMGGALRTAGTAGKQIGATDDDMNPIGEVYSTRSLHSTLLDVLGVDHTAFWSDPPIAGLFA